MPSCWNRLPVKSVVARKRNGSVLTHSSACVQPLNGLRCQGWERCLVQALIQSQQPVAPSLGVRPDQKVSKNSSTAWITLFAPALRVILERPPGRTPHSFVQIPLNDNSSLFEK